MGTKDHFDKAIVRFAEGYADQNERDYKRLGQTINAETLWGANGHLVTNS